MADEKTITMKRDKVTKNCVRYAAKDEGEPPAVKQVYVESWWGAQVEEIELTITPKS